MPELIPTADEAAWLEARRQGVTASEIAVIMGLSPWDSPYALYHRKLGILPGTRDNAAMERGRVLEPYIAEKWCELNPMWTALGTGRELYAHSERPWQMATPDRMVHRLAHHDGKVNGTDVLPEAVLECKTASSMDDWGEPGTGEIPVHYRAQVLWQMDVMGVHTGHVAVLDIPRWRVLEYVIEHDESPVLEYPHDVPGPPAPGICRACGDQELMREAARDFLGRIQRQDAPDVDWRPATAYALKQLHSSVEDAEVVVGAQTASRYRAALRNSRHWEQRKKLYEAHLRERMGSARRAVTASGEVIARRDVYEVREHTRKASTVDKLVPVYPKEKKS